MPQALGVVALSLFNAGAVGLANVVVGLQGILIGAGAIGQLALSAGLSFAAQALFGPKQPKPEDVQQSVPNPTAPRARHYGRVKISGPWAFAETKEGGFHKVVALGTGRLDAIEEYWIDDNQVAVDGSGEVTLVTDDEDEEDYYAGNVRILTRLGNASQTAYSQLTAEFPEWDADHRGDGVASLYALQRPVSSENISSTFPNLTRTLYRVVARGSRVLNPVSGSTAWSDNAAAVIRDYMTHADGMRLPGSLFTTPLAVAGWKAAFNRCDEDVTLKAGSTEKRYRLWGSYTFDERPADVLGRMLQCCDGRIVPTPDGGITLDIGNWSEPSVVIDEDAITGFSDISRGRNVMTTANVITATFTSADNDYQATDADRWEDTDSISDYGEIVSDQSFNMAPSHGQCRRLMKLAAYRAAPKWVGTFQCNMAGLAAFGERFIRIKYPLFGIDEVFEVADFRFVIGEGNILQGCTIQVQSMPEAAYQWDAATEEGTHPVAETVTSVSNAIPEPENLTFTQVYSSLGQYSYSTGLIEFDPPPSKSLTPQVRFKKLTDTDWQNANVDEDSNTATTQMLSDGETYEAQARFVTQVGREGDWTDSVTLVVVSDPVAPGDCTSVTVSGGNGHATIAYTTPVAANLRDVVVYRVGSGGTPDEDDIVDALTQIVPASVATSKNLTDGDDSVVSVLSNGAFSSDTVWTKGTGWSIGGGEASHTGSTASAIRQDPAMSAGTWRAAVTIASISGGASIRHRLSGSSNVQGDLETTTGRKLARLVNDGGQTTYNIVAGAGGDVSVDNAVLFKETAQCAPQGFWDYYIKARNASGVGDLQGPYPIIIV